MGRAFSQILLVGKGFSFLLGSKISLCLSCKLLIITEEFLIEQLTF
jgi:hypothetical protein